MDIQQWSWVQSASSFAGVAGILAAFTISAIVLVLSAPPRNKENVPDPRSSQHLFYAFLVALYSLVASALLYSDVSGELRYTGISSYFTGMFAGTITALAVVQLLLAILWCGTEYAPLISLKGAKVLFTAITVLAALLVLIDQGDFFTVASGNGRFWLDVYPTLGWAGGLVLLPVPLVAGLTARWIVWRLHSTEGEAIQRMGYRVHDAALCLSATLTTLLMATVSVLREASPNDLPVIYSPWTSGAVMAMFGTCIFFFIWSLPYEKQTSKAEERTI